MPVPVKIKINRPTWWWSRSVCNGIACETWRGCVGWRVEWTSGSTWQRGNQLILCIRVVGIADGEGRRECDAGAVCFKGVLAWFIRDEYCCGWRWSTEREGRISLIGRPTYLTVIIIWFSSLSCRSRIGYLILRRQVIAEGDITNTAEVWSTAIGVHRERIACQWTCKGSRSSCWRLPIILRVCLIFRWPGKVKGSCQYCGTTDCCFYGTVSVWLSIQLWIYSWNCNIHVLNLITNRDRISIRPCCTGIS